MCLIYFNLRDVLKADFGFKDRFTFTSPLSPYIYRLVTYIFSVNMREYHQQTLNSAIDLQSPESDVYLDSFKTGLEILEESLKIEGQKGMVVRPTTEMGKMDGKPRPIRDGSIITIFNKTAQPKEITDVWCPHFVEFKWANGCNFDCAWCYLNGTLRFRPIKKDPYVKDHEKIKQHLSEYFDIVKKPSLLNSGELSDSMVNDGNGFSLCEDIIPLFKNQKKHKLLILTKASNIKKILNSESQKQVIPSFSINSFKVSRKWENGAPTPRKRIEAAKKLFEEGYQVRIRIDPIVPINNWEEDYLKLVDYIFSKFTPERITLGSLRGLQSTINNCKDRSWTDYLEERTNWGLKVPFEKRFEVYNTIIQHLKKQYNYKNVGLCKETLEIWKKLGMYYKKIKCNCIL
jgi:spore photoproduct lyase